MRQLLHRLPGEAALPVTPDVRHRLERVLRLPHGATLTLADGHGATQAVRWEGLQFSPLAPIQRRLPQAPWVEIGAGVLKGERWEWLVEKCSEVGAQRIVPLQLDHGVVRIDAGKAADKVARWQAIATEAFEQCGRADLPEVAAPSTLSAWLTGCAGKTLCVCDERGAPVALAAAVATGSGRPVAVLIGPEGGLSAAERAMADAAGAIRVTLGHDVLRAETAAVVAVALVRAAATPVAPAR